MAIVLNLLGDRIEPSRNVGSVVFPAQLVRRVEVLGMSNTQGEPERYVAVILGAYANGSLRIEVDVERTGGKLARLNGNRHSARVAAVVAALRPILAEYRAANAAAAQEETVA